VQTNDIPVVLELTNSLYNVSKLSMQMTKPRKPVLRFESIYHQLSVNRLFQRSQVHSSSHQKIHY